VCTFGAPVESEPSVSVMITGCGPDPASSIVGLILSREQGESSSIIHIKPAFIRVGHAPGDANLAGVFCLHFSGDRCRSLAVRCRLGTSP
jgi:hypothetical protein